MHFSIHRALLHIGILIRPKVVVIYYIDTHKHSAHHKNAQASQAAKACYQTITIEQHMKEKLMLYLMNLKEWAHALFYKLIVINRITPR